MNYEFADIKLDCKLFEIRKTDQLVHVEPKIFNLLVHFVKNPDVVFSADELIEVVWKGRTVSDAAVVSCIANARKAIGDSGSAQIYIKTVRGRGFRFVATVTVIETSSESVLAPLQAEPPASKTPSPTSSENYVADPTLLILPFRLLTNNLDTDRIEHSRSQYAQSMISSLEVVLMRIPLLQLSSYSLISSDPVSSHSARELNTHYGIDYLLEGAIELTQEHVVLNVQLSDASQSMRLWAERFVIAGDFDTSLEMSVTALVAKLEPQLHKAMYKRARSLSTGSNSRSLYLEASGILALKGWHHNSFSSASSLLRKSWEIDPEFSHAASYLSLVLGLGYRLDLLPAKKGVYQEAIDAAEAAIQLDDMNSSVLGLAGCALADLGFRDRGLTLLKTAVDLNPSNAQARSALGGVCLITRQVKSAVSHLRHGMKMSPVDSRLSIWGGLLSTALRYSGDITGAIKEAELACQYDHRAYMPQVILSGTQLTNGNTSAAGRALTEAYRIKPDLSEPQIQCLLGKRLGIKVSSMSR